LAGVPATAFIAGGWAVGLFAREYELTLMLGLYSAGWAAAGLLYIALYQAAQWLQGNDLL
jgi:hypothetical protein